MWIQGLYEFGIFSTYLRWKEIPRWCIDKNNNKGSSSSVSFSVPSHPNLKIRGLNVYSVYTLSNLECTEEEEEEEEDEEGEEEEYNIGLEYEIGLDYEVGLPFQLFTKITNKSKDLKWIYTPVAITIPEKENEEEVLVWLSHWKFGNHFESGDEIDILVISGSEGLKVKEFGIKLVWGEEEKDNEEMKANTHYRNHHNNMREVIGGNLSNYQIMSPRAFFLCRHYMHPFCTETVTRKSWFRQVFGDHVTFEAQTSFLVSQRRLAVKHFGVRMSTLMQRKENSAYPNYASSKWCLDEVAMIFEWSNSSSGHEVLPVFYDEDPSDVRNQTGSIGEAFARYEEKLIDGKTNDEKKKELMEKVKVWKLALREIANLTGMILQNQANGHEAKFIQEIVKEVERKLNRTVLYVDRHLVGINSRVENTDSWVQSSSSSEDILVICGMGGIGKTIIAKFVYNLNFQRFEGSCFLALVKEKSQQLNGLVNLQAQFLSSILKGKRREIYDVDNGIIKINEAICCKRILVVIDDVDEMEHLDASLRTREFYPGSKLIITTRNKSLLKPHEGTETIECLMLDMRNFMSSESSGEVLLSLKILNLSNSLLLLETPNFNGLPNLERLIVVGCVSLFKVGDTIGNLERLVLLDLANCKSLRKFPNIGMLKLLQTLVLDGCSNIGEFPKNLKNVESLKTLNVDGATINPLTSIGRDHIIIDGFGASRTDPGSIDGMDLTNAKSHIHFFDLLVLPPFVSTVTSNHQNMNELR
ncbi:hypothetical protein LguiA_026899 [Lonicera macranthoides]